MESKVNSVTVSENGRLCVSLHINSVGDNVVVSYSDMDYLRSYLSSANSFIKLIFKAHPNISIRDIDCLLCDADAQIETVEKDEKKFYVIRTIKLSEVGMIMFNKLL